MTLAESSEHASGAASAIHSLRIEQVSFDYGGVAALRDVTVTANRAGGRVIAVLGPNASGKSTLLRCVIGALRPIHGQVVLDGASVHHCRPRALAQRLAYVPQRSIVSATFTVRQVVELGRYALQPKPQKVNDIIQRLDLTEIENRRYRDLSVGQQQRASLARAMAQLEDRGVLVLDEPTSAMDLQHIAQAHQVFRETADNRGVTVLIAMHDLSMASAIADEVWLLDRGRLVASGATSEVLNIARLETLFGVPFEWHTDSRSRSRLLPQLPSNSRSD